MKGAVTSTASGPKNLDKKADHWSLRRATITKEESEGVKLTAAEGQEVMRDSCSSPKRKAVIRVESEETQDYVPERHGVVMEIFLQKKWRRLALCRAR